MKCLVQFGHKLLEKENELLPFKKKALVSECEATHWKENTCMLRTTSNKETIKRKEKINSTCKRAKALQTRFDAPAVNVGGDSIG